MKSTAKTRKGRKDPVVKMPERKARIAFIGCGSHANANLYPTIARLSDRVELVSVCDEKVDLAEKVARTFGAQRSYSDMNAMLDNEEVDGVAVIGPPQMHQDVGAAVLRRGLPLLVEKPSGINSAQAERLARLAQENGTFGMVAFMKRFAYGYRLAKHLVEQDTFGGVRIMDAKFSQGAYPSIWGIESPASSFLTGQVIHLFDLVRFFGGDVEQVYATYSEVTPHQFGFLINLRFINGAICVLNLNTLDARDAWRDFEEHLVITGIENQVAVEDMMYLTHRSGQDWIEAPGISIGRLHKAWRPTGPAARPTGELLGYEGEILHFAQSARDKTPTSPGFIRRMETPIVFCSLPKNASAM